MKQSEKLKRVFKLVDILDDNIRQAIKLQAYFSRAAYQEDIKNFFNQSKGAQGYNIILDSLYFELIMTVARLFDDLPDAKHADNTASLPQLKKFLQDKDLLKEIEEHSVKRKTPRRELENELLLKSPFLLFELKIKAVFDAQRDMSDGVDILDEIDRLKGSHMLARVQKIRNEMFAHTAIERKKKNQAEYKYGDAKELLKQTMKLVSQLKSSLVNIRNDYYKQYIQECENYANFFWEKVIYKNQSKANDEFLNE